MKNEGTWKTERKKETKSEVLRWKRETDVQSEGPKGAHNQVDFKATRCQSTAGLINSPLAGIIVQAAFEIHQSNVDLL